MPDRAEIELLFRLEGDALNDGLPLHLTIDALTDLQAIFDKTYLELSGKKRVRREDRYHFQLKTQNIRTGSLETYVGIFMTGTQVLMPFYSQLGPKGIWDYTQQVWEFLKIVFEATKAGEKPTYSFSQGDNSQMTVYTGTVTNTFNAPVYQIAQASLPYYENLTDHIQNRDLDKVSLGNPSSPEIVIGPGESDLFVLPSVISDNPQQVDGEIYDFNKFDGSGKISVFQGQSIPHGDYRFKVIGNQDSVAYIEAMMRTKVTITCLLEQTENPFDSDPKITKLQIISVE